MVETPARSAKAAGKDAAAVARKILQQPAAMGTTELLTLIAHAEEAARGFGRWARCERHKTPVGGRDVFAARPPNSGQLYAFRPRRRARWLMVRQFWLEPLQRAYEHGMLSAHARAL
eukprot:COSAG03_NODE_982_length_5115_cov_9.263357_4_plen_117_part_00